MTANYVPEASVMRRSQTLSGVIGRKEKRRCFSKSCFKDPGLTRGRGRILLKLRQKGADGIPGGAVKCVDIGRNTRGEGDLLVLF